MSYLFSLQETFHNNNSTLQNLNWLVTLIQYIIYTDRHTHTHTHNNNCYYISLQYLYTYADISFIKRIRVLSILKISKPVHFQAKSNNKQKFHQFPHLLKYTYTQS
jgi:hypothetical protein